MRLRSARWWFAFPFVLAVVSCGGGSDESLARTSTIVRQGTTPEMLVFSPVDGEKSPLTFVLHGLNGSAADMAELAEAVAAGGSVVFVPTYRTDLSTEEGFIQLASDIECGYRFARSVAPDYGGDLDQPVVFVGYSLGASFAVQGGLDEEIDPTKTFISCFDEPPRADVIVAIAGCYSEYEGQPQSLLVPEEWANRNAEITLVAGDRDTTCAASQSTQLADELRRRGYAVDVEIIEGDHASLASSAQVAEIVRGAIDAAGES